MFRIAKRPAFKADRRIASREKPISKKCSIVDQNRADSAGFTVVLEQVDLFSDGPA